MTLETLTLAFRCLYYVYGISAISDREYDALEKLALESAPANSALRSPGSDRLEHYSAAVRTAADILSYART